MISGLIPHRYARALYKFAGESNNCEAVYDEMKNVVDAFRSNSNIDKVLSNPFVDRTDKRNLLLSAAGKAPGEDYKRFVSLILDHRREQFAYLMALAYRDIYRKENKISQVTITTAARLPESELSKLRDVVERSYPGRSFEYQYSLNPDLIGGFVIDVDSTRLDASISSELEQLRHNLSSN